MLLKCEGLVLRFAGLTALDGVDLSVDVGEILAVIGPNGAGKSTLFNVFSGIYKPTSGRVLAEEEDISRYSAPQIVSLGIARTFQSSRLFVDLSVIENVIIGMHTRTRTGVIDALFRPGFARRELTSAAEHASGLLRSLSTELHDRRFQPAGELPQADRRRVEIARALASGPKLLLLDEPSSGMDERETDQLIADIRRLRSERPKLSIIVIEHDMRFVAAFPDRVLALDAGRKIAEGNFSAIRQSQRVQEAYLGRASRHDRA